MTAQVSRRALLGASAVGLVGGLAACKTKERAAPATAPPLNPADWASVRAQFPLSDRYAQFAAFVFASHPAPVRAAIDRHRAGLDEDPTGYLAAHEPDLEQAVATAAARYLGATTDQIAFTDSTTMGLGLLYGGLDLTAGDEVITSTLDFYSTYEALRLRAVRDGIKVNQVSPYGDPATVSVDEAVGNIMASVRDRTRVVAVTWVHSATGVKMPIRALADALGQVNAGRPVDQRVLLCVDGVHGFGVEDASPDALGCDFLVSGTHKWLFGPRGTGLVWGRAEAWRRFSPTIPTFERRAFPAWWTGQVPQLTPGAAATPGGYHSFEHRWAVADAFAMHAAIGRDRIAARTHEHASALKDGLAAIKGVRLITPRDPAMSAGVICCQVGDVSPAEAVGRLRGSGVIASATPYATSFLRLGPSLATDEKDVRDALAAIRALI